MYTRYSRRVLDSLPIYLPGGEPPARRSFRTSSTLRLGKNLTPSTLYDPSKLFLLDETRFSSHWNMLPSGAIYASSSSDVLLYGNTEFVGNFADDGGKSLRYILGMLIFPRCRRE